MRGVRGAPLRGQTFAPLAPVIYVRMRAIASHSRASSVLYAGVWVRDYRRGGVPQNASCSPYISFFLCSLLSPAPENAVDGVVVLLLLCCRFISHQGA